MAVLRWVVLVLAFFLSLQSSLAAVEENWLKDIVLHIRNEYELGDTYSLAVNVPVNQDPDSLADVLQDDPADSVKQALSLGQVYQGTRIVAAARSDALARVLEKMQPLIKSSEGNVLIVYSEGYPKAKGIASKITSIIQNWRSYAFVFSKVADVADAEEFKQQELSKFGLENIFRCYEPDDSFRCTNCRAGSDVAPSCVADTVQSNDEQEAGTEIGSPATDSGTDEGYDSGPNNWLGPGLAISSNQDIDENPNVAEGMTDIMGGRRARKGRNRQKGKKGEMLKGEGEQGKLGQGGKVKEGGKRGRGGRVRKGGKRGRGGRVRKGGRRRRGGRVRKGGRRTRGGRVRKGGRRARGGSMSVHFEERSGVVPCKTPWGSWYQTMEEVFIEVHVPPGTSAKEVKCRLGSRDIELQVRGKEVFKGRLFDVTVSDEATWTLEDKCLIRIVLMKTNREAGNCWSSLLEGEYCANAWVQDQMQRKLTLERFQRENPGFDFSGAEISGNFAGGGPDFSSLQK